MDADGPRLCLVLDLAMPPPSSQAVMDVLAVLDAETLILAHDPTRGWDLDAAQSLVKAAQSEGVAVLIESDVALAQKLGTDGVHLPWQKEPLEQFEIARQALGPDLILGADVGRSRHEAMEVGEAGADYIGFGIPAHVEDRETAVARQLDLVAWWAEVFEVPVVAFDVESADHAAALFKAGADFVAVRWPGSEADAAAWAKGLVASLKANLA